jgi:transposase
MSTPQEESGQVRRKELTPEERERLLAESREKMEWDNAARLRGAEQKGQEEARRDIARKLIQRGMSIEDIMKYTSLSRPEILALQTH